MYRIFIRYNNKWFDIIKQGKEQKITLVGDKYIMKPDDRHILFETRKDVEIFSKTFENFDAMKIIYEGEINNE